MTSLAPERNDDPTAVAALLCGTAVGGATPVRKGGNSRVFRADAANGACFALKFYPPRAADPRDRLGAEAAALAFLAEYAPGTAPRLIASDPGRNVALLEWIPGTAVGHPADTDVDMALDFLGRIHALRNAPGAARLALASEACLSAREVEAQLDRRFRRLADAAGTGTALATVLDRMAAARNEAVARARALYRESVLDWSREIGAAARTLSPSDFGFHNTLRRENGSLVFLDFEYFGWDDPAKLACDIMLHPGMDLPLSGKLRFLNGLRDLYVADPAFRVRVRALYPLFGLRWCTILLNEFLPEKWAVRAHAGGADIETAQRRQLEKTEPLLQRLLDHDDPIARALDA